MEHAKGSCLVVGVADGMHAVPAGLAILHMPYLRLRWELGTTSTGSLHALRIRSIQDQNFDCFFTSRHRPQKIHFRRGTCRPPLAKLRSATSQLNK
eukprot:scaffold6547_cov144-Skeletonema_menzelii.AAC.7